MKQELVQLPRRIMRVTRPAKVAALTATAAVEEKLKSIASRAVILEKLQAEQEAAEAELQELLSAAGMQGYTDGEWEANIVTKMSKSGRTPDPVKVAEKIGLTNFMKVVKVSVTELKGHMTDREIDAISELTPAMVTGTELKVGRVKRKVKKG